MILTIVIREVDEQLQATEYRFDALGRLREVEDPNHLRTTFLYDAGSNLTRQIDPSSQPTDFVYDGLDRVSTEKDGNNHVTTSLYDPAGHLTAVIDPNSNRTDFGNARVISKDYNIFLRDNQP